jgi:hypothetical protein
MRSPQHLIRLRDAELAHDGKHLAVVVETEATALDVAFSRDQLIETIEALLAMSSALSANSAPRTLNPIPVQGLGLAAGRSPEETLLVVRLAGVDLSFQLASSAVAALGHEFSQMAMALSAHSQTPS